MYRFSKLFSLFAVGNKKIFFAFVMVFAGVFSLYVAVVRMPQHVFHAENYTVQTNIYSISFYTKDKNEPILRISPLDDFYYKDMLKDHILSQKNFTSTKNYFTDLLLLVKYIFGQREIAWQASGENKTWKPSVQYVVNEEKNGDVRITRSFNSMPASVYAVGESMILCSSCNVMDQSQRMYLSADGDTSAITFAAKHQFIPLVLSANQSLIGITSLSVLDSEGKVLMVIPVYQDEEVFYNQKFHILELKRILPQLRTNDISETMHIL